MILLADDADVDARDRKGSTALMGAVFLRDRSDIVRVLLANGADPNARGPRGETPLAIAAARGNTDSMGLLLAQGALVDAPSKPALMLAAQTGHIKAVELLVAVGANVDAKDDAGYTASMAAEAQGYGAIVQLLNDAGVSTTTQPGARSVWPSGQVGRLRTDR